MVNPDNKMDNASDFVVVDGDPAPEYSHSPPREDEPQNVPKFDGMNKSIDLGNDVLTALDAAVTKLYDANRTTTLAVPILLPDKKILKTPRRGYGTADPAPPQMAPAVFKRRVQRMTTSEAAGYACGLDLVELLRVFATILKELGDVSGGANSDRVFETMTKLADVLVAGYQQWARSRAQLELGKGTSYWRILSMFNVYTSQCKTQRLLSIGDLPEKYGDVVRRGNICYSLSDCVELVRSHATLGVSQAWAEAMASVLPLVVQSCASPERYRKCGSLNQAKTYEYYVESLLEDRIRKSEEGAEKIGLAHGFGLGGKNKQELEETDPWAAFVLTKHGTQPVVQSDTRRRGWLGFF